MSPWGTMLVPRGHPGRPSEQQEGHVGVWSRFLIDFGTVWERHFESFFLLFFLELVSRLLFVPILVSKSGCLGLLNQGFRIESIAKHNLSQELNFDVIRFHFASFVCVSLRTPFITLGVMGAG